jgi:uncharacterized membrane protein YhaH (DUF805 family)
MLMFQPLIKYAEFSGRARRAEYWLFQLFIMIAVIVVCGVAGGIAAGARAGSNSGAVAFAGLILIVAGLGSLALIIPSLAVTFRRLHDIDKPAAWILVTFVPVIGPIVLLVFCLIDGTPGPNQYGPDPKGRAPAVPPASSGPVITEVHHHYHGGTTPPGPDGSPAA